MDITPIKTEADYEAALAEIDRLMDAAPNTPRGDRLEVLVTLVEAYEAMYWAIESPDPSLSPPWALARLRISVSHRFLRFSFLVSFSCQQVRQ